MQNPYFNKRVYHFNINDVMHTAIITFEKEVVATMYVGLNVGVNVDVNEKRNL